MTMRDRKSTRLNSSHLGISYAVFCLKKKRNLTNFAKSDGTPRRPTQTPTLTTELRTSVRAVDPDNAYRIRKVTNSLIFFFLKGPGPPGVPLFPPPPLSPE